MSSENIILLVEDNPDDAELTKRAFKKSNITNRIVVAQDGAEALDYLFAQGPWEGRGHDTDPVVILLDLKLPRIGGLDVLQRLREDPRTKLLPVVILTSSVEEQDMVRGYNLGCNSYIHKPVNFNQFVESARILGLYWTMLNKPPLPIEEE